MGKTSAKNKIILLSVCWLVITLAMFFYFFKFLDASNQKITEDLAGQKKDLEALQSQKQSYAQGQNDLDKLSKEPIQPKNFFSRDTTLITEIKTLEDLGSQLNVKMQLSGLGGLALTAPKAGTKSNIAMIPYNINLYGSLTNVVRFIETLEHLSFVTNISGLSVGSANNDLVNAGFSAQFYIIAQ